MPMKLKDQSEKNMNEIVKYIHRDQAVKSPYYRWNFALKIQPWKIAAKKNEDEILVNTLIE